MTTAIKTCIICGISQDISQYYKHAQMADGHIGKCKTCCRAQAMERRERNIEEVRAHDRARGSRQTAAYRHEYRERKPLVKLAHAAVNNAVRDGRLVQLSRCEECGSKGIMMGHHDDYNEPLSVRWLCQICHMAWHKENGPGIGG